WFLGTRSAHMGPDQYVAHAGGQDGKSMSGDLLWAESEAETVSAAGNMVNAETNLLYKVTEELGDFLPEGVAVIELGPGTVIAFKNKTAPIIRKLKSKTCILVDESIAFLKKITAASGLGKSVKVKPVVDNFFETEEAYFDKRALVCSFGSTISNFVGPVSDKLPQDVLVDGLSKMAAAAKNGWMLVAFDSDHDAERIKAFYKRQALFQLNIFYRMVAELPIEGDFDPEAFDYEPQWIATSAQLAHVAVVKRDMNFKLAGTPISLKKGQPLHIKNSYKFTPEFFELCCKQAGLEVIKSWVDDSPAKIYLLKILPRQLAARPASRPRVETEERLKVA
ncbi:MAG TPA: L-histidine N(alpha)-methyltransferase, partial [Alphaproteobacteria bacterium]|nr:L-histidine N(alpha)-methyltransferase [Alphaproteobacteria bacterium]